VVLALMTCLCYCPYRFEHGAPLAKHFQLTRHGPHRRDDQSHEARTTRRACTGVYESHIQDRSARSHVSPRSTSAQCKLT
jgi:hypothetical protein